MTVTAFDLGLYAFALFVLFLTPGPVWLALLARALSGGFAAAFPLAIGVVVGDVLWPLLAILGLNWIVSEYGSVLELLRWVACAFFLWLGFNVLRHADAPVSTDSRLTRPGMIAGFLAGLVAILGNPKAILFYLGVLPGFFDLRVLTTWDIGAIVIISAVVPFVGNMLLAWIVGFVREKLSKPSTLRRLNLSAGCLLIGVGLLLPFT
jgi:threonine/homoserine/homoserine lactone efflux protein